jgi:hypothetical protein
LSSASENTRVSWEARGEVQGAVAELEHWLNSVGHVDWLTVEQPRNFHGWISDRDQVALEVGSAQSGGFDGFDGGLELWLLWVGLVVKIRIVEHIGWHSFDLLSLLELVVVSVCSGHELFSLEFGANVSRPGPGLVDLDPVDFVDHWCFNVGNVDPESGDVSTCFVDSGGSVPTIVKMRFRVDNGE